MLWDIIMQFYITKIFGGFYGGNYYTAFLGNSVDEHGTLLGSISTNEIRFFKIIGNDGYERFLTLGNYLSLIATLISMVVILILCCLLVKKIYNICAHIIG